MAERLLVELLERLVDLGPDFERPRSNRDVDHAAIVVAALAFDQSGAFESIDQARDSRNDGDHSRGDFQDRQRPRFAAEDAEDVVLLRRQAKAAKQPGKTNLKLIGGSEDV